MAVLQFLILYNVKIICIISDNVSVALKLSKIVIFNQVFLVNLLFETGLGI